MMRIIYFVISLAILYLICRDSFSNAAPSSIFLYLSSLSLWQRTRTHSFPQFWYHRMSWFPSIIKAKRSTCLYGTHIKFIRARPVKFTPNIVCAGAQRCSSLTALGDPPPCVHYNRQYVHRHRILSHSHVHQILNKCGGYSEQYLWYCRSNILYGTQNVSTYSQTLFSRH